MRNRCTALFGVWLAMTVCSIGWVNGKDFLEPWGENPWYWSFGGEPVLLLGAAMTTTCFSGPRGS